MSIEDAVEATTSAPESTPAPSAEPTYTRDDVRPDPAQVDGERNRRSIKDTLRAEFDKQKREPSPARQAAAEKRSRDELKRFAPENSDKSRQTPANSDTAKVEQPKAAPEAKPDPAVQATKSEPVKPAQTAAAAPSSLSKETRAIWDSLPDAVKNDIIKRETDTQRGVEQLKHRYQPLDEALAPYRPLLQQVGKTEAQAIRQLFAWHDALSGPNKAQAFRELARSHGFDLSTLAAGQSGQQQLDPNDPRVYYQQALHGTVSPLDQRLSALEQQLVRQQQATIEGDIGAFSKDKPYFDRVRYAMGQMMLSGYANSLEDAYNKAIWADAEVRAEMSAAETAKREAEAKAAQEAAQAKAAEAEEERKRKEREALEKARRAGTASPRGSSPEGSMTFKPPPGSKSIRDSIAEARRQVQGGRI